MRGDTMHALTRATLAVATLTLGACAVLPAGPSVMALPGTGKNFDQFRADDYSCRQYAFGQVGGTTAQRARRAILRQAMEAEGYTVYPEEWWHFDYKDWKRYPIGTRTFTELAAGR